MRNFKNDNPQYKEPKPLEPGWNYIGDGKFHDPTTNDPLMKGKWTRSYKENTEKSYNKIDN